MPNYVRKRDRITSLAKIPKPSIKKPIKQILPPAIAEDTSIALTIIKKHVNQPVTFDGFKASIWLAWMAKLSSDESDVMMSLGWIYDEIYNCWSKQH